MPDPLHIKGGPYNTHPLQLKAGQVTYVPIRSIGAIEAVNLDRKGAFWVRLDGKPAEIKGINSFVVFLSRRFNTNNQSRTVSVVSETDLWVTIEGATY